MDKEAVIMSVASASVGSAKKKFIAVLHCLEKNLECVDRLVLGRHVNMMVDCSDNDATLLLSCGDNYQVVHAYDGFQNLMFPHP